MFLVAFIVSSEDQDGLEIVCITESAIRAREAYNKIKLNEFYPRQKVIYKCDLDRDYTREVFDLIIIEEFKEKKKEVYSVNVWFLDNTEKHEILRTESYTEAKELHDKLTCKKTLDTLLL